MSLIKIKDIAWGRLRAPDLDKMEEFLTDFGMVKTDRTATKLFMRGTDPNHHLHVTEKGEPSFVGLAYYAASEEDLHRVAKAPGASAVEDIDEPGGGKRVRLREPNGYQIEVVYGLEAVEPLPVKRQLLNSGAESQRRVGEVMRIPKGKSQVKRLGHGVMATPKLKETIGWFRDTLGLIGSDDVYAGEKENVIGSFNRADRGEEYVDHHIFFCMAHETAGFNHLAFEVQDVDDVFVGHEYLKRLGKYEHMWGIGRHVLGSQIFDYWADPWGRVHEHWTDSDRLNASNGSNMVSVEAGLDSQWGDPAPPKLLERILP